MTGLQQHARFVMIPSDYPTGKSGSIAYRQQLLNWINSDPSNAERHKKRAFKIHDKMTVRQVFRRVDRVLNREQLNVEYFSPQFTYQHSNGYVSNPGELLDGSKCWNDLKFRAIAVWPTTGGSEGIYVHVEMIGPRNPEASRSAQLPRIPFALGKVWNWAEAWAMVHRIAELLEV